MSMLSIKSLISPQLCLLFYPCKTMLQCSSSLVLSSSSHSISTVVSSLSQVSRLFGFSPKTLFLLPFARQSRQKLSFLLMANCLLVISCAHLVPSRPRSVIISFDQLLRGKARWSVFCPLIC